MQFTNFNTFNNQNRKFILREISDEIQEYIISQLESKEFSNLTFLEHNDKLISDILKSVNKILTQEHSFDKAKASIDKTLSALVKIRKIQAKRNLAFAEGRESELKEKDNLGAKIFIFSDFGAEDYNIDPQTTGELAGLARKFGYTGSIFLRNDAPELSPKQTALGFGEISDFKYIKPENKSGIKNPEIKNIVVHVVDPGVGNDNDVIDELPNHPRVFILRKDGTLFIGPDNGGLTELCPKDSIAKVWEIDAARIDKLSGNNTEVGGTFHGRDLFGAAAFLIKLGLTPEDLGNEIKNHEINRFDEKDEDYKKLKKKLSDKNSESEFKQKINSLKSLEFHKIESSYFDLTELAEFKNTQRKGEDEVLKKALLVNLSSVPLNRGNGSITAEVSNAYRSIIASKNPEIIIVNHKTKQFFVGDNDGSGTAIFDGFNESDYDVFPATGIAKKIIFDSEIENLEKLESLEDLKDLGLSFNGDLKKVDFKGSEDNLISGNLEKPEKIKAKIGFIDRYGNIKTTLQSQILESVRGHEDFSQIIFKIPESDKSLILTGNSITAESFTDVEIGEPLVYVGSTATHGKNSDRGKRFVELTTTENPDQDETSRNRNEKFGLGLLCEKFGSKNIFVGQELEIEFFYEK